MSGRESFNLKLEASVDDGDPRYLVRVTHSDEPIGHPAISGLLLDGVAHLPYHL
jgi:hypothetical protein